MRLTALLLVLSTAATAEEDAAPRATKAITTLGKAPRLDGQLKEYKPAQALTASGADAELSAKVVQVKDTLYLAVEVTDDAVQPTEYLTASVFFLDAGTTARGYTFRFGPEGTRNAPPAEAPEYAQAQVQASAATTARGWRLEAKLPARAFPRFPATGAIAMEACFSYEDRDGEEGESPEVVSNCKEGTMESPALKLSEDLRRTLKLKPPEEVRAIERREDGWIGFAVLHHPVWVQTDDREMTPGLLRRMVSDDPIDPNDVRVRLPATLRLSGDRYIMTTVTGENPYVKEGVCDGNKELRMGLYVVNGNSAQRALEWPAATCVYGRANSVELEEDGTLTIGYSNGAVHTFMWSQDHFERTEIGSR